MPSVSIAQGDTVWSLATAAGLAPTKVWEHAENEALRTLRKSPDHLLPGDELNLPGEAQQPIKIATGKFHRFVVRRLRLRVRILDIWSKPTKLTKALVELGREKAEESLADGLIDIGIPGETTEVKLLVDGWEHVVHLGHLDPHDEPTGQYDRLALLGYLRDDLMPVAEEKEPEKAEDPAKSKDESEPSESAKDGVTDDEPIEEPDDEHDEAEPDRDKKSLRLALEEFQFEHDLKVTGELDDATKAKLVKLFEEKS